MGERTEAQKLNKARIELSNLIIAMNCLVVNPQIRSIAPPDVIEAMYMLKERIKACRLKEKLYH